MGVKAIGNRGEYYRGGSQGMGGRIQPVLVNWAGFASDAEGGTIYLSAGDVTAHKDAVYQGYFFQAIGSDVVVSYSLANPGVACDPRSQTESYWGNTQTVTAGSGVVIATLGTAGQPVGFAALRLVFAGAGEFFIVSR
jgi:hypothetical protein